METDQTIRDGILFELLDRYNKHWKNDLTWEEQRIVEGDPELGGFPWNS